MPRIPATLCLTGLLVTAATSTDSFLHKENAVGSFWEGSGNDAASSVIQLGEDRSEPTLNSRSSSVEESESVQTDASGRTVRVTKHCTDGHCQETTEVLGQQGDVGSSALSQGGTLAKASSFEDSFHQSMQKEVHRMNDEMQKMQNHFDGVFKHAFGDTFGEADSTALPAAGQDEERADSPTVKRASSSSSFSSEVVVKNGKAVRRIRECKNGDCSTRVEQLGSPEAQSQEPQTDV